MEAPQDHKIAGVVHGVMNGHNLEQKTVRPKDVVHLGPHLLATMERAPRLSALRPWKLAREEVLYHNL